MLIIHGLQLTLPFVIIERISNHIFPSLENPRLQFSLPLSVVIGFFVGDGNGELSVTSCPPTHGFVCLPPGVIPPPPFCPSLSQGWRRQKNWKQPYLPFFGASRAWKEGGLCFSWVVFGKRTSVAAAFLVQKKSARKSPGFRGGGFTKYSGRKYFCPGSMSGEKTWRKEDHKFMLQKWARGKVFLD